VSSNARGGLEWFVLIAVALAIGLLALSNVQLWRVTHEVSKDSDQGPVKVSFPRLPESRGGNRALLQALDRLERRFEAIRVQLGQGALDTGALQDFSAQLSALSGTLGPSVGSLSTGIAGLDDDLQNLGGLELQLKRLNVRLKRLDRSLRKLIKAAPSGS